jgi:hypothetical protein
MALSFEKITPGHNVYMKACFEHVADFMMPGEVAGCWQIAKLRISLLFLSQNLAYL